MKKICPEGKILNLKTNRCIKNNIKTKKICSEGKILNLKTNRCIKNNITTKKICSEGKILNLKTNRCIKIKKIDIIKSNNKIMKSELINNLKIIHDYEKINGNQFKVKSYNKAINIIELELHEVTLDSLKDIKGIGDRIIEKIKEFINTGKIKQLDDIYKDDKYVLNKKLTNIYGIGPAKMKELMSKIEKFDDLYLDENKNLLNNKQKIGLKYLDDLEKRIPYKEGVKHNDIITNVLIKNYNNIDFDMVGSFRRKNKDMGDIDILIKDDDTINLNSIIEELKNSNYILETLANGKKKFMGICKIDNLPPRRIDILLTNKKHYYFTLLYFTGSYNHNIIMRKNALKKGLSLSEYGYTDLKTKKIIDYDVNSEEDIFKIIDMDYVKPELRI
jgi:DNA polymerase/3'-5' exonuclease PolX